MYDHKAVEIMKCRNACYMYQISLGIQGSIKTSTTDQKPLATMVAINMPSFYMQIQEKKYKVICDKCEEVEHSTKTSMSIWAT